MEVQLKHKAAFERVLKNYQPSSKAKQLIAGMPLVILQGISGSGRNTIIDYLVKHASFHQIISDTTRPPKLRNGVMEQDGVQYHFRQEEVMLQDLEAGMYLEAEVIHNQQVSGISIRELERAAGSDKVPINEVAREGVGNIRSAKPDTTFVFVVPPSYEIWLERLGKREIMSEEELANRKHSAVQEIEEALTARDFYFVVNDSVERAAGVIGDLVHGEMTLSEDGNARRVAEAILDKLKR